MNKVIEIADLGQQVLAHVLVGENNIGISIGILGFKNAEFGFAGAVFWFKDEGRQFPEIAANQLVEMVADLILLQGRRNTYQSVVGIGVVGDLFFCQGK